MPCTGQCTSKSEVLSTFPKTDFTDNDDVWASDDENVSEHADRQRAQVNQGYLDGLTAAQELGLQSGFDSGYPEGAALGIRVGKILARLHGTDRFQQAKRELNITKVLDTQYYDKDLDVKEQHALVLSWEAQVKKKVTTRVTGWNSLGLLRNSPIWEDLETQESQDGEDSTTSFPDHYLPSGMSGTTSSFKFE